jgi:glycosyltransferase involved in cell wall biosynthesis
MKSLLAFRMRKRRALGAARALEQAGDHAGAALTLTTLAHSAPDQATAIELSALAAECLLRAGDVPAGIDELIRELLARTDDSNPEGSLKLLTRACSMAFAPARHLAGQTSPICINPEAFMAPFQASPSWTDLTASRPPRTTSPRGDGPLSVLVLADSDHRFSRPLIDAMKAIDSTLHFTVRTLDDIAGSSKSSWPLRPFEQIQARSQDNINEAWYRTLLEAVEGFDVVWVEWCQRTAVLVSLLDLPHTNVVIRLHSFEAFTVFPHLLKTSGIDSLVTVSPALHSLINRLRPALAPQSVMIPNAVELSKFTVQKSERAAHTLGLIGWNAPDKDAVWALDLLAQLRQVDPRWELVIAGAGPADDAHPYEKDYEAAVRARADQPDVAGAVTFLGQRDDIAVVLQDVGVIVSSSVRESFHVAVAEGIASGAFPVIRDWPGLAQFGGPHGTWPEGSIVSTPEQGAQLIQREFNSQYDAESLLAKISALDSSTTAHAMRAVLRGNSS